MRGQLDTRASCARSMALPAFAAASRLAMYATRVRLSGQRVKSSYPRGADEGEEVVLLEARQQGGDESLAAEEVRRLGGGESAQADIEGNCSAA